MIYIYIPISMLICVGRTGVIGDGSLFGTGEAGYTISPEIFRNRNVGVDDVSGRRVYSKDTCHQVM